MKKRTGYPTLQVYVGWKNVRTIEEARRHAKREGLSLSEYVLRAIERMNDAEVGGAT